MTPTTQIPVVISDEAAARVAKLGLQRELDQMIEHARQASGLRAIAVTLEHDPACPHGDPTVEITAYRDVPPEGPRKDRTSWDWAGWQAITFPPEVRVNLSLLSRYGDPDGR